MSELNDPIELNEAIENGDEDQAKMILRSNPSAVSSKDGLDNTPLHVAVYTGLLGIVELLLDSGAEIDARGDMQRTPLHYAAMEAQPAVAELLLKRGAASAIVDSRGNTPLYYAVQGQLSQTPVAKHLLEYHVPVDLNSAVWLLDADELRQKLESSDNALMAQNERILMEAVIKGDLASVKVLIQHGVSVNGNKSTRPLVFAIPRPDIFQELLEHGADPALPDSFDENVFERVAASKASDEIARLLNLYKKKT